MATVVTTSNLASNSNSNMKVLQSPPSGNSICHRCSIVTSPDNCIGCHHGAFFHRTCLTCRVCDIKLTLVSYHVNKARPSDLEIYCSKHVPSSQWYDTDAAAAMHPEPAQPAAGSWSELERESQVAVNQGQGSKNEHRPAPPPRKHKPAAARPGTVPPQPPTTLSTAPTIAPKVEESHSPPPPVPKRPPPPAQKPAVPREDASINIRATATVVDTSDTNKKILSVAVDSTAETKPPNRPTLNLNEMSVSKPRRTVFLDKELLEDITVAQSISETHQKESPAEHSPAQQLVVGHEHDAKDEDIKPEVVQPMVRRQGGVRQQQRATAASLAQEALQSRNQRHMTYRQPSEETGDGESIKSPTSPSKPLPERQAVEAKPVVAAKHKHPSTQERDLNTSFTGANKEATTPQPQYLLVQPSKPPQKPPQPPADDENPLKLMDSLPVNVDNAHDVKSTFSAPCKVPPPTAPKPATVAATSQPPQLPPKRPPPRPAPPGKSQDAETLLTSAAEKEPIRTVSPQPPARPQPPKKTADKKPTTKWHQDIDQLVIEEQSIRNQPSTSAEKDKEVSTKIPNKRTSINRSSSLHDVTSSSMSMTSYAAQPPPVPAPRRGSKPEQHILKDMGGVSFEFQLQNPASPRSDEAAATARTQLLRRPLKQMAAEPSAAQPLSSAATPQLPSSQTIHSPPPSTPPKPATPTDRKSELPDLWVWPQFNARTSVRASGIQNTAQESSNNEKDSLERPGSKKSKRLSRSKSVKAGSVYDKSKRASVRPTTPPPEVAKPPRNWDSIMEATVRHYESYVDQFHPVK